MILASIFQNYDFLSAVGIFVSILLLGAVVLARLSRWCKRQLNNSPAADIEQMNAYREMFENGELSREEYDAIKVKEARRLKDRFMLRAAKTA
jgi:hypothetical protein